MTTPTPRVETLTLQDGREVTVHEVTGGPRVVVLCHPAAGADPDPIQTGERAVRLIGVDWPACDQTADDLAQVLDAKGLGPVGVAGWGAGAELAAALAARRPDLVSRLVIGAAGEPSAAVGEVAAKTLLMYAQSDPAAGPRDGRAWQRQLGGGGRLETIPRATHLPIGPLWKRVLSFLAPGKA
jgi:pimeloyl-ACP methyl ester carboxylesterase